MSEIESLDYFLAEALECLDESAAKVRQISELEMKESLYKIGAAISNIWELREHIHELRPDLKPTFVNEYQQSRVRHETLFEMSDRAYELEGSGKLQEAAEMYELLREKAVKGYFSMVAEAGLYRLSQISK